MTPIKEKILNNRCCCWSCLALLCILTVTSCQAREGELKMMIILSNNSATMIDDDILRNIILVSRYFVVASLLTKHQDDHGGWRTIKQIMSSMVVPGARSCSLF